MRERSSGIRATRLTRRAAREAARALSQELSAAHSVGSDADPLWEEVEAAYEAEVVPNLSRGSRDNWRAANAWIKRRVRPYHASEVTTWKLTLLTRAMRRESFDVMRWRVSEASIVAYLRSIKAALDFAHEKGLLPRAVTVPIPKATQAEWRRPAGLRTIAQAARRRDDERGQSRCR